MIRLKQILLGKLVAILLATQLLSGFPTHRSYFALEAQASRINLAQLSQKISEPGGFFRCQRLFSGQGRFHFVASRRNGFQRLGRVFSGAFNQGRQVVL